eukprot:7488404-Pyramimonas_sp.AAC.1
MPAGQTDWGGQTSNAGGPVVWRRARSAPVRLDKCNKRGIDNSAGEGGSAASTRRRGRNSSREFRNGPMLFDMLMPEDGQLRWLRLAGL